VYIQDHNDMFIMPGVLFHRRTNANRFFNVRKLL